jgi:pimeloyl-ACP methyl ester carboxylesterase
MAALADEFCVVAVDLPGHGVLVDEPFELEAAADHVGDLIATVLGRPAVVVGLSLGGYVAMALAARRPELVRALVLSGATAEPIGVLAAPYRALAWAMLRFDGSRLDALNARFFRSRFVPDIADPILAGGFWSRGGAVALRALIGERFAPRLAAYPGPTLIVNGEYDLLFRLSSRTFAGAAHDARRVRLRGATHLANLDRPEAFSEAVRRFVRSLDEPG